MPMEEPDFVENSYPKYIRRSANITVLLRPAFLYTKSMSEEICLLSKVLLTKSKDMPCGSNSYSNVLPVVVSTIWEGSSSSLLGLSLTFILACKPTVPE